MTGRVKATPPPSAPVAAPVAKSAIETLSAEMGWGSKPDAIRAALERIANGRLCGCHGDPADTVNDCPRTIARRALEGR
jgi:hypothetical protein